MVPNGNSSKQYKSSNDKRKRGLIIRFEGELFQDAMSGAGDFVVVATKPDFCVMVDRILPHNFLSAITASVRHGDQVYVHR